MKRSVQLKQVPSVESRPDGTMDRMVGAESVSSTSPSPEGIGRSPRTTVRDIVDRARREDGIAVLATHMHERLVASLQPVGDHAVRLRELEELLPVEAAMALDRLLSDVASRARACAEQMLSLPVDVRNMPDVGSGDPSASVGLDDHGGGAARDEKVDPPERRAREVAGT